VRFTIRRYPAPLHSHNTGSITASTGAVRVIVCEGVAVDKAALKKLGTTYKLTPAHRIHAAKQVKVVAINTRKARAAQFAGEAHFNEIEAA